MRPNLRPTYVCIQISVWMEVILSFFSTCHFASLPLSLLDLIFSNLPRTLSWYQSRESAWELDRSVPLAIAHGLMRRKFKEDSKKWRYEDLKYPALNQIIPFTSHAKVKAKESGKVKIAAKSAEKVGETPLKGGDFKSPLLSPVPDLEWRILTRGCKILTKDWPPNQQITSANPGIRVSAQFSALKVMRNQAQSGRNQ